jgi:SNF2 family DNA or RNA helicase
MEPTTQDESLSRDSHIDGLSLPNHSGCEILVTPPMTESTQSSSNSPKIKQDYESNEYDDNYSESENDESDHDDSEDSEGSEDNEFEGYCSSEYEDSPKNEHSKKRDRNFHYSTGFRKKKFRKSDGSSTYKSRTSQKSKRNRQKGRLKKLEGLKDDVGHLSTFQELISVSKAAQGYEKINESLDAISKTDYRIITSKLGALKASAPLQFQEDAEKDAANLRKWARCVKRVNQHRGYEYIEPDTLQLPTWQLRNFNGPLYTHQFIAVCFILWRESKQVSNNPWYPPTEVPGGFISDLMGLGKTRSCLAAIFNSYRQKSFQVTLIVVPNNLRDQWEAEIRECFPPDFKGLARFNTLKRRPGLRTQDLKRFIIVLATYHEVRQCGILKATEWHRLVLDEGHNIKNHRSSVSKALCEIDAKYRWIVTGTPVTDKTDELFSYFKFLRIEGSTSMRKWHKNYPLGEEEGQKEMGSILSKIHLRRHYNSRIFGRKIFEMPFRSECVIMVRHLNLRCLLKF